jgi:Gnt-I system high-affinity gluconate transporter
MPIFIVIAGIVLLLILMLVFKFNGFLSFVIVSLVVGLAEGMPLDKAVAAIQEGIGHTLGYLVIIIGFGAMLGKLVAESGAAQRITASMIDVFGMKRIQLAVMVTGFIIGVPLFYDVGFVIMIPLVFTVAVSANVPLLYVGLPMLASLSVTHGYLPPHPAPTAILHTFGADMGKTMIYGTLIAIPAILLTGSVFYKFVKKIEAKPMHEFVNVKKLEENEMPSLLVSILSTLLPVILIGMPTIFNIFMPERTFASDIIGYIGNPVAAMTISLLVAMYTLGIARGRKIGEMMDSMTHSVSSLTMVILVIGGAGGLKQILVDSGTSTYIGVVLSSTGVSPLILGWFIATMFRIFLGSATVAGITTAGIVLPLVHGSGVNPELMVLAIGSGSLTCSHVNDGGFWLVKEYFNLSVADTFRTWTVMETCVGFTGLAGVLILNVIIS